MTAANLNGGLGGVTYADTSNLLNRTNKISINSGATVKSTRDINLRATVGEETVVESAREYNSYTGVSGQGSLVSTALGEKNSSESINNFVELNGNVTAGDHNELDIVISNANGVDTSKAENVVNMKPVVSVTKGGDWFSADEIEGGKSSTVKNPFLDDYQASMNAMQNYLPSSDSYKELKQQADNLAELMVQHGFAEKGSQNDYRIYESAMLSTVSVPKVALGGEIIFNGGSVSKNGTNFNAVDSDLTGNIPVVNIEHTGRKVTDIKPDVLISGNITNTEGGGVEIIAPNGGFMLNDSKGLYKVGSDPLAMFTFGNKTVSDELASLQKIGQPTMNT